MSKHDADCLRRKLEPGPLFLCTCEMTDQQVQETLHMKRCSKCGRRPFDPAVREGTPCTDPRCNGGVFTSHLPMTVEMRGLTRAEQDRQLIIAQEVFAGRLVPTDDAAMERAIYAVNRAHESKIDSTWRELLTVAFRAAGETPDA